MKTEIKIFESDPTPEELKGALFEYGIVCIRTGEDRTTDDLKAYANIFGDVYVSPRKYNFHENDKSVANISAKKMFSDYELHWHKDMAHTADEYPGAVLYCKNETDIPTDFCYTLNTTIDNQIMKHGCYSGYTGVDEEKENKARDFLTKNPQLRDRYAPFEHHLLDEKAVSREYVHTHPISGETVVYASPATVIGDNQVEIEQDILNNNVQVRHTWEKGDVLFWDNYVVMHTRGKLDQAEDRQMLRITYNYNNV